MDSFDPSVLLKRSRIYTFTGQTGSIGVEFLEVGAGIGKMAGRSGYVPWALMVGGLSLSAVPLQASYHGKTQWTLHTANIRLAEAFITFSGVIVYGLLCATVPLKTLREYQQVLDGLNLLSRLFPAAQTAYEWFKARGDDNSVEIRAEGARCGNRIAYYNWEFRNGFIWSTPQAAVGVTSINFAGTGPLEFLLRSYKTVGKVGDLVEDAVDDFMDRVRLRF